MATRLEIAQRKLERLQKELEDRTEALFADVRRGNGQPMNDKRNGRATMNRWDKQEQVCMRLYQEIKEQEERVSGLKWKEENWVDNSNTAQIARVKDRIEKAQADIENKSGHAYTKAYMRKDMKRLTELEEMQQQAEQRLAIATQRTLDIIESGAVTQWARKPIIYFVKGMRKVGFFIDECGNFRVSNRYPFKTDEDRIKVNEMLGEEVYKKKQ